MNFALLTLFMLCCGLIEGSVGGEGLGRQWVLLRWQLFCLLDAAAAMQGPLLKVTGSQRSGFGVFTDSVSMHAHSHLFRNVEFTFFSFCCCSYSGKISRFFMIFRLNRSSLCAQTMLYKLYKYTTLQRYVVM